MGRSPEMPGINTARNAHIDAVLEEMAPEGTVVNCGDRWYWSIQVWARIVSRRAWSSQQQGSRSGSVPSTCQSQAPRGRGAAFRGEVVLTSADKHYHIHTHHSSLITQHTHHITHSSQHTHHTTHSSHTPITTTTTLITHTHHHHHHTHHTQLSSTLRRWWRRRTSTSTSTMR